MAKNTALHDDPLDAWRKYLTQTEREWNTYLNEFMGSDGFSRVMGTWMTSFLAAQKSMGSAIERTLTSVSVPTRSDVQDLGERLGRIEERLRRIETAIAPAPARSQQKTPPRTRKPPAKSVKPKSAKPAKRAKKKASQS